MSVLWQLVMDGGASIAYHRVCIHEKEMLMKPVLAALALAAPFLAVVSPAYAQTSPLREAFARFAAPPTEALMKTDSPAMFVDIAAYRALPGQSPGRVGMDALSIPLVPGLVHGEGNTGGWDSASLRTWALVKEGDTHRTEQWQFADAHSADANYQALAAHGFAPLPDRDDMLASGAAGQTDASGINPWVYGGVPVLFARADTRLYQSRFMQDADRDNLAAHLAPKRTLAAHPLVEGVLSGAEKALPQGAVLVQARLYSPFAFIGGTEDEDLATPPAQEENLPEPFFMALFADIAQADGQNGILISLAYTTCDEAETAGQAIAARLKPWFAEQKLTVQTISHAAHPGSDSDCAATILATAPDNEGESPLYFAAFRATLTRKMTPLQTL